MSKIHTYIHTYTHRYTYNRNGNIETANCDKWKAHATEMAGIF